MKIITGLSEQPKQQSTLVLADGTRAVWSISYVSQQTGWFYDLSWNGTVIATGQRMVSSPNILRQYLNKISFGIAVVSPNQLEPTTQTALADGSITCYLLEGVDLQTIETELFNAPPGQVLPVATTVSGLPVVALPANWGPAGGDLAFAYPNPQVVALHDGAGQRLAFGVIGDGKFLQRSGSTIIGATVAPGTGNVSGPASSVIGNVTVWADDTGTLLADGGGPLGTAAFANSSSFLGATAAATGDLAGSFPSPTVTAIHTSTTQLTIGAIADGQFLVRSGTTLIGSTPSGAGDVFGPSSTVTVGTVALFATTDGKTLGPSSITLGSIASQAASGVNITGGSMSGVTLTSGLGGTISGVPINGSTIGAISASTGRFTTVTADSVNKIAITAPATGATLTIANGATLTASATATVSGINTGDNASTSGNAGTATALQTARTIGGSLFDGTANVTSFPSPGPIGGTISDTGKFTALNSTSLAVTGTITSGKAIIGATSIVTSPDTGAKFEVVGYSVLASGSNAYANLYNTSAGLNKKWLRFYGNTDGKYQFEGINDAYTTPTVFFTAGPSTFEVFGALSATGLISKTNVAGTDTVFISSSGTTTGANGLAMSNSGGNSFIGLENSLGTFQGGTAYDLLINAASGRGVSLFIAGTGTIARATSIGLAVTGSLSSTGTISTPAALQIVSSGNNIGFFSSGSNIGGISDELVIYGQRAGDVIIYRNAVEKLRVTSTGLAVTGSVSATAFSATGVGQTIGALLKASTNGNDSYPIICRNSSDVNKFYVRSDGLVFMKDVYDVWTTTDAANVNIGADGFLRRSTTGTVTGVSVVTANGFVGSVTSSAIPAITISTSVTGIVKGNGTALSVATAGTDYVVPTGSITGNAANVTGTVAAANGGTGQSIYAVGDILYASTTTALSKLEIGAAGQVLTVNAGGTALEYGAGGSGIAVPIAGPQYSRLRKNNSTDITATTDMNWAYVDTFNITDYGASPSATPATNTAAIVAAFAAATVSGGCVFVPQGVFKCNKITVTITENVALMGCGQSASVLKFAPPATAGNMGLKVNVTFAAENDPRSFEIQNLCLWARNETAVSYDAGTALEIVSSYYAAYHFTPYAKVLNCWIRSDFGTNPGFPAASYWSKGISLASTHNYIIDNCFISGKPFQAKDTALIGTGIYQQNTIVNAQITNNQINYFNTAIDASVYSEGLNMVNNYMVPAVTVLKASGYLTSLGLKGAATYIAFNNSDCANPSNNAKSYIFKNMANVCMIGNVVVQNAGTTIISCERVFESVFANNNIFGPTPVGIKFSALSAVGLSSTANIVTGNMFRGQPTNVLIEAGNNGMIVTNNRRNEQSDSMDLQWVVVEDNNTDGSNLCGESRSFTTVKNLTSTTLFTFDFDITSCQLGRKPSGVTISLGSEFGSNIVGGYDVDNSTRTSAKIKIWRTDGTNLPSGNVRFNLCVNP